MFLHVDPDNGLAIYDQIVRQIKFAVATGALPSGEMAPSVRELARELAVNLNTVSKAYQQLQLEGVLENVRGMGLAVATGAVKQCRAERVRLVQERLREVLWEARQSGIEADELQKLIAAEMPAIEKKLAAKLKGK
ncbi:MAG: GntR family transcriptional regulator [Planctomycetota bacterium]|nr:MAG: GntR family transcriptional regulator [Planctomycetota bacterium]